MKNRIEVTRFDHVKNGREVDNMGNIIYFKNDSFHREDGPAIIHMDGYVAWYRNGKRHNESGPAILWPTMDLIEWYINGFEMTEQEFLSRKIQKFLK